MVRVAKYFPYKKNIHLLITWIVLCSLTACSIPANSSNSVSTPSPAVLENPSNTPEIATILESPTITQTIAPTEFQPQVLIDTQPPIGMEPGSETPEFGLPTDELSTEEATPQPTPTIAHKYPSPMIMIESPGPLSKISTPILLQGSFNPGEDGMLYVELFGTEGSLVGRQVLNFRKMTYTKAYVSDSIPFDIQAAGTFARLVVSTHDKNQRVSAVASVDLILMQMGGSILNPPSIVEEPYVIQNPKPDDVIRGGVVRVSGVFKPVNNSPLLFQLTGSSGEILGSGSFFFAPITADQSYATFVVDISYSVPASTAVRLSIFQNSDNRIPGVVWLTSEKVTLSP